jgi:hypothetical protein
MIQLQRGAAYSDNQARCVRSSLRGGCRGGCDLEYASNEAGEFRTLLEEINNYSTETTRRRPSIGYSARNYQSGIPGQCVRHAPTALGTIDAA